MIRLIGVELLKLRTTRLTYGLLATAAALTGVFAVIEAARAGSGGGPAPLSTASGLNDVITAGIWALVLATVMGVTVSSGEFRHGAATLTYLATPHRGRVLTAKLVAQPGPRAGHIRMTGHPEMPEFSFAPQDVGDVDLHNAAGGAPYRAAGGTARDPARPAELRFRIP